MTQFFKQYHSIKPYLVNDTPPPEKERLQSPEEREELNGLYECILCACCSTACPSLLVEPRQVRRPGRPAAGLPLHRRQPRPGDQRAPRQPRGSVPPVPLPHDHELRRRLPEGPQSDAGDRQDQGTDGAARRLSAIATLADERSLDSGRRSPSTLRWRCRRGCSRTTCSRAVLRRARGDAERRTSRRSTRCWTWPTTTCWDLLLGRSEPDDATLHPLVDASAATLRACVRTPS